MNWKHAGLRIVVSAGALGFLFYKIDVRGVLGVVTTLNGPILLLFLVLPLINLFFSSLNLALFFYSAQVRVGFWELVRALVVSRSIGFFLPGRLGELSLGYLLRKNASYGVTTSIQVVDKLVTFVVLLLLSGYGFFRFFDMVTAVKLLGVLIAALAFAISVLFFPSIRIFIRTWVLRKYANVFEGFGKMLNLLVRRFDLVILNFIFTFSLWLSTAYVLSLIFESVGYHLSFLVVAAIHSIGMFSSFIPVSIAGIGVRESIVVYLYTIAGVDSAVSAGIYLVVLFFSYLYATMFLVFRNAGDKS